MSNYRIAFDFAAETPREAVSHLLGIVEDPEMRTLPLHWLVTNQDTGEETKIVATLDELEQEAAEHVNQLMDSLRAEGRQ